MSREFMMSWLVMGVVYWIAGVASDQPTPEGATSGYVSEIMGHVMTKYLFPRVPAIRDMETVGLMLA
jgi:hypothetical protein